MSALLQPLAAVFRLAVAVRAECYAREWLTTRKLARPVVSVGNLTTGGTGKTPLVLWIAEALLKHGRKPGILTRGYGRESSEGMIVIGPGSPGDPEPRKVGDEPALLAKALPLVPIVVSADRYRAGRAAEERFGVGVHVLDDGFQHWALARDVDVVALDITQDLTDRALLPAGRQREPCAALARAHVVVITRTELGDQAKVDGLEHQVRSINRRADVFRASTRLDSVWNVSMGRTEPAAALAGEKGRPVAAFCGVGNPRAFFSDLRYWGFRVAAERAYRDHHAYSGRDLIFLQQLAARSGAEALLTTEKDIMNLPSPLASAGVPVFACIARIEIEKASIFEERLLTRLETSGAGM